MTKNFDFSLFDLFTFLLVSSLLKARLKVCGTKKVELREIVYLLRLRFLLI